MPGANLTDRDKRLTFLPEKEQVQREPHPECVNRAAAGDQQALGRAVPVQQSKSEQPGERIGSDRHLEAMKSLPFETVKPPRRTGDVCSCTHVSISTGHKKLSPADRGWLCNKGFGVQPMVQPERSEVPKRILKA